jgi:hypothetical protein
MKNMGYNTMQFTESQQTACFHAGILVGSFDTEDGGNMFLKNIGSLSMDYTALYPRR